MKVSRFALPLMAVLALSAGAALAQAPATAQSGALVDAKGMTLYTFDKDSAGSGKSVCNGPCEKNWPPLAADADGGAQGDWTVVTRDDGSKQWAYKGMPLYRYVKDTAPGEKKGDNFKDVWHVAKP